MRKNLILVLGLVFLAQPSNLLAWGTTGHRVIAEIAERNLTVAAKEEVQLLLNMQPMAYWANWPDFIRSEPTGIWKKTFSWHYLDAPANQTKDQFISYIKKDKDENIYSELPKLISILKSKKVSDKEKSVALKFIIHFVGDMHQPMHTGRPEDMGGNKISVTWFKDQTNLHSVWDSKIIDYQKYSYTEYATILNVISPAEKVKIQSGTIEDWLYESHTLADKIYEMTPLNSDLSYNYIYKTTSIVESQLQKAGFRLAEILNDSFK